jgi:hypothetical protein
MQGHDLLLQGFVIVGAAEEGLRVPRGSIMKDAAADFSELGNFGGERRLKLLEGHVHFRRGFDHGNARQKASSATLWQRRKNWASSAADSSPVPAHTTCRRWLPGTKVSRETRG